MNQLISEKYSNDITVHTCNSIQYNIDFARLILLPPPPSPNEVYVYMYVDPSRDPIFQPFKGPV